MNNPGYLIVKGGGSTAMQAATLPALGENVIDIDEIRETGAYLAADANESLIEELCAEIERLRVENDELRITAAIDDAQRDLISGKLKPMTVPEIMAEIEKE